MKLSNLRTLADNDSGDRLHPPASLETDNKDHPPGSRQEHSPWPQWLADWENRKNVYVIVTVTVLPLIVFFPVRDPVDKPKLPEDLQPGWLALPVMVLAGLFFTGVAVLYSQLSGLGLAAASLLGYYFWGRHRTPIEGELGHGLHQIRPLQSALGRSAVQESMLKP